MAGGKGRLAGLVVASSALLGATAHAEPPSPRIATALSVTPTVLGIGLGMVGLIVANQEPSCSGTERCIDYFERGLWLSVAGGALITIGPSAGHAYAGRLWSTGLKVRLVGLGIGAVGAALMITEPGCGNFICPTQGIGALIAIGGAVTVLVGAGVDATSASDAARSASQLTIATLRTPSTTVPALVLSGSF